MTYITSSYGINPQGVQKNIPVGGQAFLSTSLLGANASMNTGWMPTSGYGSLLYVIRSDKVSATNGIVVEYSDDGSSPIQAGTGLTYSETPMQIQRVLVPKASYTRITYTNGSVAQTSFRLEVKLSPTLIQPTESSLNVGITGTELAMITTGPIQASDGTSFQPVTQTTTGSKVALDVNIASGSSAGLTDTQLRASALSIKPPTSLSATVTRITSVSSTSGQILAANANRKGFSISSEGTLYILFGTGTVSSTNYSVRIVANGYYEPPEDLIWQGAIQGVGAVLQITEFS